MLNVRETLHYTKTWEGSPGLWELQTDLSHQYCCKHVLQDYQLLPTPKPSLIHIDQVTFVPK